MVIVGVGAAAPGSEALLARTVTHCSPLEFSVDARKWQPGLFGAPRPVFTSVCVCIVGRRVMFWAPGSRDCHGVPSGLLPRHPGQIEPRDGARMGGGSAGQQQSRPTTASETLTGGMSKGRERRIKAAAGFRLRLSDRIHLLLLRCVNGNGSHV